jgi:hypothetical protein
MAWCGDNGSPLRIGLSRCGLWRWHPISDYSAATIQQRLFSGDVSALLGDGALHEGQKDGEGDGHDGGEPEDVEIGE